MLKINIAKRAEKFLTNLPSKQAKQIAKKLISLRENPQPHDSEKLKDSDYLRNDIGEYRIIYCYNSNLVEILLIGKRNDGEVYKKLKRIS